MKDGSGHQTPQNPTEHSDKFYQSFICPKLSLGSKRVSRSAIASDLIEILYKAFDCSLCGTFFRGRSHDAIRYSTASSFRPGRLPFQEEFSKNSTCASNLPLDHCLYYSFHKRRVSSLKRLNSFSQPNIPLASVDEHLCIWTPAFFCGDCNGVQEIKGQQDRQPSINRALQAKSGALPNKRRTQVKMCYFSTFGCKTSLLMHRAVNTVNFCHPASTPW